MTKFNVQLAQMVREVAACVVEAPSRREVDRALGEIFDDSDGLRWESDDSWGSEPGTHTVDTDPGDIDDALVDFVVDHNGSVVENRVAENADLTCQQFGKHAASGAAAVVDEGEAGKTFAVYVVSLRSIKYWVNADTEDEAKKKVEESRDADEEFGGKDIDGGEWYIDSVEECG